MWCLEALFLAYKYLDIILHDIVCQTILSITLFLPIYIMCEKTMEGKGIFNVIQLKRQTKTLYHLGLHRKEDWSTSSLGYQRTIHL